MPPSAPKPTHPPFPRLCAHAAHLRRLAPTLSKCLTPLLCCSSIRALSHPRALRHPTSSSSRSRRVRDESRSGFASRSACGARGVIHDPGVRVRTCPSFSLALRLALRLMRTMAMFTLPVDLVSAVPLTLTRFMLLASADTCPFVFFDQFLAGPRIPPGDRPHRLPKLRRRAARRR